jgi:hypothetical protein
MRQTVYGRRAACGGAIIQALKNDPSRTALSNDEAMRASGVFGGSPRAPYMLRQAMSHRPDLLDGLKRVSAEIAKHIYPLERWYIIDATYLKSPYYEKQNPRETCRRCASVRRIKDEEGRRVPWARHRRGCCGHSRR